MSIDFLKLFAVLLISLGLAACGGAKQTKGSDSSNNTTTSGDATEVSASEEDEVEVKVEKEEADQEQQAAELNRKKLRNWAADELMLTKVYFKYNKHDLNADSVDIINLHAEFLQEYPEATLQLHGHADERGSQEYNLALGDKRASSVSQLLIDKGIDASRLIVISFGESRPIDGDHDEKSWVENRRVEFLYE